LTGNEELDNLITDLTYKKYFDYDDLIEEGTDENGQYKILKRWEIGKADYFLDLFKTTYYTEVYTLLNIEESTIYLILAGRRLQTILASLLSLKVMKYTDMRTVG
jgi:hypothetical protein